MYLTTRDHLATQIINERSSSGPRERRLSGMGQAARKTCFCFSRKLVQPIRLRALFTTQFHRVMRGNQ
jgi:hypothetical protein